MHRCLKGVKSFLPGEKWARTIPHWTRTLIGLKLKITPYKSAANNKYTNVTRISRISKISKVPADSIN